MYEGVKYLRRQGPWQEECIFNVDIRETGYILMERWDCVKGVDDTSVRPSSPEIAGYCTRFGLSIRKRISVICMNKSENTYRDITQCVTMNDHCPSLVSKWRKAQNRGWTFMHIKNVHPCTLNAATGKSNMVQDWLRLHCNIWATHKIQNPDQNVVVGWMPIRALQHHGVTSTSNKEVQDCVITYS